MRTRLPDPGDAWTDDDARIVLDEWQRSGETMAAFARQHGLTAARLYWWKKRLRRAAPSPPAPTLSLVPASIVSGETTLTIRMPGEVAIEVANASPSWAAALIAELARPLP
jgi:transposase-like protein